MTEAVAQTVLQMGMTNYQPLRSYAVTYFIPNQTRLGISYVLFRYTLYTVVTHVSYANSVTRFICRPLRRIRPIWRRFRPMFSNVVISRTVFRHNAFSTDITKENSSAPTNCIRRWRWQFRKWIKAHYKIIWISTSLFIRSYKQNNCFWSIYTTYSQ